MSLDYIMDRFAIQDTITRGAKAVDLRQPDMFDEVFAGSATIDYRPLVEVMDYTAFKKWAADWAATASEHFHSWMHILSNMVVEIEGDSASVVTDLYTPMVLKDQSVQHFYGRYHDKLARTDKGWRIVHRWTESLQEGDASNAD